MQDLLLSQLANAYTKSVVDRLHKFIHMRPDLLDKLSREVLKEDWAKDNFALEKYLAVQIPWSIEQGLFTEGLNQWYLQ